MLLSSIISYFLSSAKLQHVKALQIKRNVNASKRPKSVNKPIIYNRKLYSNTIGYFALGLGYA